MGDRVLVKKPNFKGLEVPYHGPYRVSEVLDNDRVRIRDLHRVMHDEFHVSKLKLYPYVDNDGNMAPARDEYVVEDVIGCKDIGGVTHYRIKWRGWNKSHSLWQPLHDLDAPVLEFVAAYEQREAAARGDAETSITTPVVEAEPVSHAPLMRSHVEHHLDAAPPGFTPDRSPPPDAAMEKRAGKSKKRKKKKQATLNATSSPASASPLEVPAVSANDDLAAATQTHTAADSSAAVDTPEPLVVDTTKPDSGKQINQRTLRSGNTAIYNA